MARCGMPQLCRHPEQVYEAPANTTLSLYKSHVVSYEHGALGPRTKSLDAIGKEWLGSNT